MYIPKDLLPVEARENTLRKVEEVLSRFAKDGVPLLDPEEDMKVSKMLRHVVRFPLFMFFLIKPILFRYNQNHFGKLPDE